MDAPFLSLMGFALLIGLYSYAINHITQIPAMSADKWHIRHFAFTNEPVSPPYCWRPLFPILARHLGFKLVSYSASIATIVLIYRWVGGGWTGFLCAAMFVGNPHIFPFHIRNPEYTESLGQLLFMSSLWAVSVSSPLAWPLLLLSALCRETIAAALGIIVLFVNPLLLVPLVAGSSVAWFGRKEEKENRHPLVEGTAVDTVKRWIKYKKGSALHFAHVIQPLRCLAFTVPFMWHAVGPFARLGLLGFIPIWLLALPASGQSRIICYGFGLLIPFAAATPIEWLWVVAFFSVFWPIDYAVFDESGGEKSFGFAR